MLLKTSFALLSFLSLSSSVTALASTAQTSLQSCAAGMDNVLPGPIPTGFNFSGNVRRYYIAAEEVLWNYAPTGWDNWLGVPFAASPRAYSAGYTAKASLGSKWQKALYRGYTDASFTKLSPQPPWQGASGPTLRAEVGDMIEILFVNKLSTFHATMHSMGLQYNKDNEGSLYPNTTSPGQETVVAPGDDVAPGECTVYKWLITSGAAPTQGQVSHMWGYHSYISLQEDLNAGLLGSTIVYAAGKMNATIQSYREFVLMYMQYDESNSWMSGINKASLTGSKKPDFENITAGVPSLGQGYGNYSVWGPQVINLAGSGQLSTAQAPTWSSLNGLVYSNNARFEVCANDPTIWYVAALGANPHVFHMHGNGFIFKGDNLASISVNDGEMKTLHSTMGSEGEWGLICHVSNHLSYGMLDNYIVHPPASCPLPKLAKLA